MRRRLRSLPLLLAASLLPATGAYGGVLSNADFRPTPFTKGVVGAGNAAQVKINWLPGLFDPAMASDHHDIVTTDLDTPGSLPVVSDSVPSNTATTTVSLLNGHRYDMRVVSCQKVGRCTLPAGSTDWVDSVASTRIDATPPTGTVQINAGALATNNRAVTLALTGADPLVDGIAGSSSGVTEFEVDEDGNGTFPCNPFGVGGDSSGCSRPFGATTPITLPEGDGMKLVGVVFGDGAREMPVLCPPPLLCISVFNGSVLGNSSLVITDKILLDTTKPLGVATQDRFVIERGGTVVLDADRSFESTPLISSGVDLPTARWDFKDATPPATGQRVAHTFARVGTFVGEMRVNDKAGNVSDPRAFSVTVTPRAGETTTGGGTVGAVTGTPIPGTAQFTLDRVRVSARYRASRLAGSLTLTGSSPQAGQVTVDIRSTRGGATIRRTVSVPVGNFTARVRLPATLLPGSFSLRLTGPGGSLASSLKLLPPREGVVRSARVLLTGRRPTATFALANLPATALRGTLTVVWSQGGRVVGLIKVRSAATIRAPFPAGASRRAGAVRADLRAGKTLVGTARG